MTAATFRSFRTDANHPRRSVLYQGTASQLVEKTRPTHCFVTRARLGEPTSGSRAVTALHEIWALAPERCLRRNIRLRANPLTPNPSSSVILTRRGRICGCFSLLPHRRNSTGMHVLQVGLQSGRGVGVVGAFNKICGVHCKKRPQIKRLMHSFRGKEFVLE